MRARQEAAARSPHDRRELESGLTHLLCTLQNTRKTVTIDSRAMTFT